MSIRKKFVRLIHFILIATIFSALLLSACCPKITGFSPGSGGEGTEITIQGERFGSTPQESKIKIGGMTVPNAHITHASSNSLKVRVPADARSGPISVGNVKCSGESDDDFTMQTAGARPDLLKVPFKRAEAR